MRKIKYTKRFKQDYKRAKLGHYRKILDSEFLQVINYLVIDQLLPERYCDHSLKGEWQDHRDCHVKPDLVLIYRKPDNTTLQLVRLGSHSELSF